MTAPVQPPITDNIPAEIRESRQCVGWVLHKRDGDPKPTKLPVNVATGELASSTDSATWSTFAAVIAAVKAGEVDGAGFVFTAEDDYVGIDLDRCINVGTGEITDQAMAIVNSISSYTEVSPSGTGLHIIAKGILPPGRRRKGAIEAYAEGRYFTMSGNVLPSTPRTIEERSAELARFHDTYLADPEPKPTDPMPRSSGKLDDLELIEHARAAKNGTKFAKLFHGDHSGCESQSEADQALVSLISFWTQDPAQIDRVFRQSGLARAKWLDREDYRDATIATALRGRIDVYSPDNGGGPVRFARRPNPVAGGAFRDGDDGVADVSGVAEQYDRRHLTDLGNALRFVDAHHKDLRYCGPLRGWFCFDGRRWELDTAGEVQRRAIATIADMEREAADLLERGDEGHKALAAHVLKSEAEPRIRAMLTLAENGSRVAVAVDAFDQDEHLLNLENGTIDLATGTLRPHRSEDLITRLAPVVYDPAAIAPQFQAFLRTVLPQNDDLNAYLQRATGYSLLGSTQEQCFFLLYGTGANGKSTWMETIHAMLGDYAMATHPQTFLQRSGDAIPNDIARLRAARFISTPELDLGKRLNETLLKSFCGGDTVSARFMRREFFEFQPKGTIFIGANQKPEIRGVEKAIWRRLKLIPFTVSIPPEEQDKSLLAKLRAEAPGILNWALAGCLAWQQDGLGSAPDVEAATAAYREEMDPLAAFIDERCLIATDVKVSVKDLFRHYKEWAETNSEKPLGKMQFNAAVTGRDIAKVKSTIWWWHGITLHHGQKDNSDHESGVSFQPRVMEVNPETAIPIVRMSEPGEFCACGGLVDRYTPEGEPVCAAHVPRTRPDTALSTTSTDSETSS
ncbi:MAG: phage/plasmid primase, P4 family [Chloroflexi bacterium]|nr:phage/plasmid primase, P4 family [Chloroflexota bacterium]